MTNYQMLDKYVLTLDENQVRNILKICIDELILTETLRFNEEENYLYWINSGENLIN